jgi:hypothetical protein
MNNENITSIKTVWIMVCVSILTLFFGVNTKVHALTAPTIVYNKNILYINKYVNLVNIKNIINIDILNNNKKNSSNTVYLINDLSTSKTFLMPAYSKMLNLKQRVDSRVIISRLANAIQSQETGGAGAYYRKSYSSSACGAYQYMSTSWDNFMGYKSACDAPEWVQDEKMINELKSSYAKYHDWKKVVAAHLYPSRAGNMATWNKPVLGNPTVREYVTSVFQKANIAY